MHCFRDKLCRWLWKSTSRQAESATHTAPVLVPTQEHVEALWGNLDLLLNGWQSLTRLKLAAMFERVVLTPRDTQNGVAWQLATGLKLNAPRELAHEGGEIPDEITSSCGGPIRSLPHTLYALAP
jgi:hypothetical protein